MNGYNHYVRIDTNNNIIYGFSDAFEQPNINDVQLIGDFGRQFQTQLTNDKGQYLYKIVNGQMVQRAQAELDTEWNARPPLPPSPDARLASLESSMISRMGL